jgi:hypothetical protein
MGGGDGFHFELIAHAGFLQVRAEGAVDESDGGEILDAREAERFQLAQEMVPQQEGIRAVHTGEDGCVFHGG